MERKKMKNELIEKYWNVLVENGVSEDTLQVITCINGYTIKTLQDVLYVKFGLRDFDELMGGE